MPVNGKSPDETEFIANLCILRLFWDLSRPVKPELTYSDVRNPSCHTNPASVVLGSPDFLVIMRGGSVERVMAVL